MMVESGKRRLSDHPFFQVLFEHGHGVQIFELELLQEDLDRFLRLNSARFGSISCRSYVDFSPTSLDVPLRSRGTNTEQAIPRLEQAASNGLTAYSSNGDHPPGCDFPCNPQGKGTSSCRFRRRSRRWRSTSTGSCGSKGRSSASSHVGRTGTAISRLPIGMALYFKGQSWKPKTATL